MVSKMWAGSVLGRGNPIGVGYTGVEVVRGCNWVRREGGLVWVKIQKLHHIGSVLSRGNPIGAGYAGVEVARGHDRAKCKGGWFGPKNQKLSHWGLVLASKMQAGSIWGRGDPIGVGYAGFEVVRGHDQVRCKGGLVWATEPSLTATIAGVAVWCTHTLTVTCIHLCSSFSPCLFALCSFVFAMPFHNHLSTWTE